MLRSGRRASDSARGGIVHFKISCDPVGEGPDSAAFRSHRVSPRCTSPVSERRLPQRRQVLFFITIRHISTWNLLARGSRILPDLSAICRGKLLIFFRISGQTLTHHPLVPGLSPGGLPTLQLSEATGSLGLTFPLANRYTVLPLCNTQPPEQFIS